ncbi:hypothetical protein H6G96_40090 [Nostoc sp. FACHB-892]|uniref:hypothetical protein n=1 Tax=Nostoc sp. FACHB-892 TaxID=2692843 RepID=UPI0016882837|nr:hypothetical protein [Nostoc sp. FACHB-892]MBD2732272.1 hypothetical protein [Nostoc sp. FACHB-892]
MTNHVTSWLLILLRNTALLPFLSRIADGKPYWNGYLGQWQVWVSFTDGCKSVVCDWLKAA